MYIVQNVGQPFAGAIPENEWGDLTSHRTLPAAMKACVQRVRDMKESQGPQGWNDHYRVKCPDGTVVGSTACEMGLVAFDADRHAGVKLSLAAARWIRDYRRDGTV